MRDDMSVNWIEMEQPESAKLIVVAFVESLKEAG